MCLLWFFFFSIGDGVSSCLQVLKEIGATDIPILTVWNKIDLVPTRHLVRVRSLPHAVQKVTMTAMRLADEPRTVCSLRASQKEGSP